MKSTLLRIILLLTLSSILSACASQQVAVPRRFFWPPEPDVPRIEWIAAYNGDLDIKKKTFMTEIIGDDSSIRFGRPISVAGDGEGKFVVSDQELGQVFMFDINKYTATPIGGSSEATSFGKPSGVAVDAEGNFYIADNATRKIFVVSNENQTLRVIDFSADVLTIGAIAIDRVRGTLIVPDAKGSKLILCSLTGEQRKIIDGKGYFSFPNAVAVASDASMYIADSFNARIVHITSDGKFINSLGRRGDGAGDLTLVTGVAVDSEDHIYATDGRLHNLTIFDKDGNILLVVGAQHSINSGNIGRGGFQIPQGVSIDKNDRIYVADSLNRRVQIFQYLNKRYTDLYPIAGTGK